MSAADARIEKALEFAETYASTDGEHHKMWVIDQMVRALTGCPMATLEAYDAGHGQTYHYQGQGESEVYTRWVASFEDGEDGPETYEWDSGTPP